jgi:hypothetical protein
MLVGFRLLPVDVGRTGDLIGEGVLDVEAPAKRATVGLGLLPNDSRSLGAEPRADRGVVDLGGDLGGDGVRGSLPGVGTSSG